ncbi:hypothetical protein FALCPG4_016041 [Fusarium falciforme]
MDPLSITTACVALLAAVGKTTLAVTDFVRDCREARSDLAATTGELSQLHLVLELLKDDAAVSDDRIIPESLQVQILSIIENCSTVVVKINTVLQSHAGRAGVIKWVSFGKSEIAGLRMSLEAHRGSLSLILELVSVSLSKAVKDDTLAIRTGIHDIKQDTRHIPQIIEELTRLRAIVAAGEILPATSGQNYVLQQYLDGLTSYAETVCNDVVWDSDSSVHAISRTSSREDMTSMPSASDTQRGGNNNFIRLPTKSSSDEAIPQVVTVPDATPTAEAGAFTHVSDSGEPASVAEGSVAESSSLAQHFESPYMQEGESEVCFDAPQLAGSSLSRALLETSSVVSPLPGFRTSTNFDPPHRPTIVEASANTHRQKRNFSVSHSPDDTVFRNTDALANTLRAALVPIGEYDPYRLTPKPCNLVASPTRVVILSNEHNSSGELEQTQSALDSAAFRDPSSIAATKTKPPNPPNVEQQVTIFRQGRLGDVTKSGSPLFSSRATTSFTKSELKSDTQDGATVVPTAESTQTLRASSQAKILKKLLIVGDSSCGKSVLLSAFLTGVFTEVRLIFNLKMAVIYITSYAPQPCLRTTLPT